MTENENKVIDITEETSLTTTAKAQTEAEPTSKVGIIGKVCGVLAVGAGLISLGIKGYLKSKQKSAKKASSEEDVADVVEPTSEEDEVSE